MRLHAIRDLLRKSSYETNSNSFSHYVAFLQKWGHDPVAGYPLSFVEACLQLLLVARKLPGQNTPDVVSDLLGRKTVTALQESGKIGR